MDNFIDDIFVAGVDHDNITARITHAVPLALETLFQPEAQSLHNPRAPIISITKHLAEGLLDRCKTILGWRVNTRSLQVHLTQEKANDWTADITTSIKDGYCTKETLESMIGRFNHVGCIIHLGKFFLTRLRYCLHKFQACRKKHCIYLKTWDIDDLRLWQSYITTLTQTEVSLNNICITALTATTYSDACKWGIGGYTVQGHFWRWQLPQDLHHRASINLLEFLATIITIELLIQHDIHSSQYKQILAYTNCSSVMGWMFHSTFNPTKFPQHNNAARHLATTLLNAEATLHPKHVPGCTNIIADCLSCDHHLTNDELLLLLYSSQETREQMPPQMTYHALPKATISWVASMLESLPPNKASPASPEPSKMAALFYSNASS